MLPAENWPAFYVQVKEGLGSRAYLVLVDADGRQVVNTFVPYGEAPELTGDPARCNGCGRDPRPVISDLFTSLVAQAAGLQHLDPGPARRRLRYVMSLGLLPEDLRGCCRARACRPIGRPRSGTGKGIIMARTHEQARLLGTAVPHHLKQLKPEEVVRTTNINGEEALIAVGRGHWSNWTVDVSFPAALVDRQLRNSLLFWGATLLLVGGLVVGLAFLFGRALTRPLAAATAAAGALGRGETLAIRASGVREVNAVGEALVRARHDIEQGSAALRRSEEQLVLLTETAQFGAHEYDVPHDRALRSPQFLQDPRRRCGRCRGHVRNGVGFRPSRRPQFDPAAQAANPGERRATTTSSNTASAAATGRYAG